MPPTPSSCAHLASDLRVLIGRLVRRLRAENRLPLTQGAVLGRLERCGDRSIGELAACESVRPQSMAQTVADLEEAGLVRRAADPADGRRVLIDLTDAGREAVAADRAQREGWLAQALETSFDADEREAIRRAVELLSRLVGDA
ncbi:MAG TPA: MarR family transcriptional regulator [Solirubrobacteraceae bacterium]|jgi:DNA-binding MarR family transcriptional regulator|nr:MarR family transcriptional regulator [Solirubrobacteraceae bacterium]